MRRSIIRNAMFDGGWPAFLTGRDNIIDLSFRLLPQNFKSLVARRESIFTLAFMRAGGMVQIPVFRFRTSARR
jgi:hypothetical protein